ncbi:MAG: hypothetical protein ABWY12_04885, partial [Burkholderiales bacterium]
MTGIAAVATIFHSTAFGETPAVPATDQTVTVPSVVVSATRTERPLAALPVSATVIPGEEMMQSSSRTID